MIIIKKDHINTDHLWLDSKNQMSLEDCEKAFYDLLKIELHIKNTLGIEATFALFGTIPGAAIMIAKNSLSGFLTGAFAMGVGAIIGWLIGHGVVKIKENINKGKGTDPRDIWKQLSTKDKVLIGQYCLSLLPKIVEIHGRKIKYSVDASGEKIICEDMQLGNKKTYKATLPRIKSFNPEEYQLIQHGIELEDGTAVLCVLDPRDVDTRRAEEEIYSGDIFKKFKIGGRVLGRRTLIDK